MTKRIMALLLCGLMILSFAACGSKDAKTNAKEDQKQFLIVGGMSALSSGNDSNPVLVDLAEKAGVEIEWDLMSDSLGEKVGVLIGGNQLPDAFIDVGFSQNDINEYGGDATIPMSTGYDQWCWGQEIFYAGFGFTNFTSDICFDLLANPDGTVQFVSASKAYRDAVTYFHDWYAEGLMDLEMFSQSTSQLISKVSQGRVGLTTWWEIKEIAGDHTDDFVFLPPMYGPAGTEYAETRNLTIRSGPGVTSGNLNVTSACGNPTSTVPV